MPKNLTIQKAVDQTLASAVYRIQTMRGVVPYLKLSGLELALQRAEELEYLASLPLEESASSQFEKESAK